MSRYITKFVNSYWTVFDTENYENVQVCFLSKEAVEATKKMNFNLKKEVK